MEKSANISKDSMKNVADPVCGMKIASDKREFSSEHDGQIYYFCAKCCLSEFEKNPEKYSGLTPPKKKGLWARYLENLNRATGGRPVKCH